MQRKRFLTVSLGSSKEINAASIISEAAQTRDEKTIHRALEVWGDFNQDVVRAVKNYSFSVDEGAVVIHVDDGDEKQTSQPPSAAN